jgi:hypothetical protein
LIALLGPDLHFGDLAAGPAGVTGDVDPPVPLRGGRERIVTVLPIGGHTRLDTLRVFTQPTEADKLAALDHLTADR